MTDLKSRFDDVLNQLESVAGWTTARVNRPVLILDSRDGIETGIRQLIRETPLEASEVEVGGVKVTLPTEGKVLHIKAALILKRNAMRDYLDFVALTDRMGEAATVRALERFDDLYPQPNGEPALQQLQIQLASQMPFDLDQTRLNEYKNLNPAWHDWNKVRETSARIAIRVFEATSK